MLTPEFPGPHDVPFGGLLPWLINDNFDKVFPKTTIDHLLSDEERQKAEQERKEFEAVGRRMHLVEMQQVLYSVVYDAACEEMAAGTSPEEMHAEMVLLADTPDLDYASIVRQAYEDVLA